VPGLSAMRVVPPVGYERSRNMDSGKEVLMVWP
jgi:hypothetical protein